jgi:beta-galactosidase
MTALGTMAQVQRRELFDFGWQFTRNGKTMNVDLPHDWDIYEGPHAGGATGTGGGWFEGGKGEYRKTFATPDGSLVKLHFEGVYQHAEVYVNGQKAGQHAYGYTPFTVDITPYLKKKKTSNNKRQASNLNEVVVKVDNSQQPNCRWYSGSGIYRHVWLETMPSMHIAENGVFVSTPEVSETQAQVNMSIAIENDGELSRYTDDLEVSFEGGTFTVQYDGPTYKYAPTLSKKKNYQQPSVSGRGERLDMDVPEELEGLAIKRALLKSGYIATYTLKYTIGTPHLWSPDDPYLYTATVRLKRKGKCIDEKTVRFGIRSFSFDAEKGFVLNGRPTLINGACVHHDDGVLGAMAFDAAEIRKVRQMKDAGFNLIRTSHNPTTRAFLDACDSLGMLVIDEAFDGWRQAKTPHDYATLFDSCYRDDIHAMVERDRNHPSIISWSIGNEVMERKDIRVITTARQLKQAIQEMDSTRLVTEALCSWDNDWEIYDPHAEVLDVVGYNYMIHKHAGDHKRAPQRVMWQTESYPRDAFRNWALANDYPYIVGDIVWTGLDYLGESGIGRYYYQGEREGEHYVAGGQPDWHGAYCGDVDITGWRKPISHYRQMLWSTGAPGDETLYMAVKEPSGYFGNIKETAWSVWPMWESWTWKGWEGKPINIEVYTKKPEVKLYLNDQLVEVKQVSRDTQFKAVFTVDYQPGTLRAEAGGKSVALSTAGEPARLRLTADRLTMKADGQDLAFVSIEVVDSNGRVCPETAIPCEVNVSGRGRLLAAASALLKDTEPYATPIVKTWKGRALIVVRSTQKAGTARVSVKSSLPGEAVVSIAQK